MDTVRKRAADVIGIIRSRLQKTRSFEVNVMGGELFFDEIPDPLFEDYFFFALEIHKFCENVDAEVSLNWVTNLVYSKTERVLKFMEKQRLAGIDSCLTTSYDPRGRFNTTNYKLFKKNLDVFSGHLRNISVVMTRPNIKAILKGDPRLDELYKSHPFYFDYYSPESNFQSMLPKDSELFEFFKHMLHRFPEAQPFKSWRANTFNKMTCRSSDIVLPTGETGKCRALLSKDMYDKFYSKIDTKTNSNMEERFTQKRNCITCEYFKKCGLGCFLQTDFIEHNDLDDCLFYKTFHHIDESEA